MQWQVENHTLSLTHTHAWGFGRRLTCSHCAVAGEVSTNTQSPTALTPLIERIAATDNTHARAHSLATHSNEGLQLESCYLSHSTGREGGHQPSPPPPHPFHLSLHAHVTRLQGFL